MIAEDYSTFVEWLEKYSRAKSSMHHPVTFDALDHSSGQIVVDTAKCAYVQSGEELLIWFLHPGQQLDPSNPNMKMTWTDTGWETQTFLGPGLWNSKELAEECVN